MSALEDVLKLLAERLPGAIEDVVALVTEGELADASVEAVTNAIEAGEGLSAEALEAFEDIEELAISDVNELEEGFTATVDGELTETVVTKLAALDPRRVVAGVTETEEGQRVIEFAESDGSLFEAGEGILGGMAASIGLDAGDGLLGDMDLIDDLEDDAADVDEGEDVDGDIDDDDNPDADVNVDDDGDGVENVDADDVDDDTGV